MIGAGVAFGAVLFVLTHEAVWIAVGTLIHLQVPLIDFTTVEPDGTHKRLFIKLGLVAKTLFVL